MIKMMRRYKSSQWEEGHLRKNRKKMEVCVKKMRGETASIPVSVFVKERKRRCLRDEISCRDIHDSVHQTACTR